MLEKLIQEYEIRVADKTAHYMETTMIAEFLKKLYVIRKKGRSEAKIKQLEAEIRIAINMCDIIIQFGGGTTAILRLKESLQKTLED